MNDASAPTNPLAFPSNQAPGQPGSSSVPPQQSGTAQGAGMSMLIMGAINSAIALVKNPLGFMATDKDSPATVRGIMVNYVAVLAAIPFFATLIGYLWYYDLYLPIGFAGSFLAYAFVRALLVYILDVASVYVIAVVIRMLAPTFNSTADEIKSLKLAAYIYTPVFLIGVLDIVPILGILTILGVLYGLYILYLGLPVVLGTPKEKVMTYVIATVVATLVVYFIVGAIIGAVSTAIFLSSFGYFY